MRYSVIIAAGGTSRRFRQDKLLATLPTQEKVIIKTIRIFVSDKDCQEIIVGCSSLVANEIKTKFNNISYLKFCERGDTRFLTINNCLQVSIKSKVVMIHDGARCYLTLDNLTKLKKAYLLKKSQALIVATEVTNTIKLIDGSQVITLDRQKLLSVQTPQVFARKLIVSAYQQHYHNAKAASINIYDDSQLIEMYYPQIKIEWLFGWNENIKITYPQDVTNK